MNNGFYFDGARKISALKNIRPSFAVEVLLTERLQGLGISPFKTFLNTAADVVDFEVVSSKTLFDETLEWVEKEAFPNYVQTLNDVFSQRYSFKPEHRVAGLGMPEFERIVIDIVRDLTSAPSVNLSKRSIRTANFEEIHAALKYSLPELNINDVYITSFIEEMGETTILKSRSWSEDVYRFFQADEIPYYHGEQIGVYSVAYSLQEQHRHPQLTIGDISNVVIDMVPDFLT